ncbi:hypothetical protein KP509_03G080000 [Ceratopteris richardii]|uniref:SnoaL-like domain-containing protein n=1 Tax=Ceratopteris richardii TaxID=49495 RepID=A0A8T2VCW7_CERRI|nr:hypothetical protein KP509_03G080000 [Ceratopteris richardii]
MEHERTCMKAIGCGRLLWTSVRNPRKICHVKSFRETWLLGLRHRPLQLVATASASITLFPIEARFLLLIRASATMAAHQSRPQSASDVILEMYAAINRSDSAAVGEFLAEDVVYDDLHIFEEPMHGRAEVLNFFNKFFEKSGSQLVFILDGITRNDPTCCGIMWHMAHLFSVGTVEHKGDHFPCSRGCSFYRFENRNGKLQLVYGRDIQEPAKKHGLAGLEAIRSVLDQR